MERTEFSTSQSNNLSVSIAFFTDLDKVLSSISLVTYKKIELLPLNWLCIIEIFIHNQLFLVLQYDLIINQNILKASYYLLTDYYLRCLLKKNRHDYYSSHSLKH